MSTFVEIIQRRAATDPAGHAFSWWDDPAAPVQTISYGGLDRAARAVALALADQEIRRRPVLLLHPPGPGFVTALVGCLYAGAIAVPAQPPDLARWQRQLSRLRAVAGDCGAAVALTDSRLGGLAADLAVAVPELAGIRWMATDALPAGTGSAATLPEMDGDCPALLQYTSGSTGSPKGVLLSHGNLVHNAGLVHTGFGTSPEAVGVSWLPPYHDMGLIGGILQPLYAGFPVVLMSPLTFLRRPLAWLEAVTRFRATMTGGPNFAFDLCVRASTAAQRAELDLSTWTLAFCGAEPVRADTLDRFAEAFAVAGFRREALYPCYGLAEATLIVTGGQPPRMTATGQVGCGRPLGGQRLVVVDLQTATRCPPGVEGEIWLSGPSVSRGYWRRPEESRQTFDARLSGDGHGYLRTGDLGFLDPGGDLVITGRIKDLIIVRGRDLHPADLEHAVERRLAGMRPGQVAAFPVVRSGEEQVGLACEVPAAGDLDLAETVSVVRQGVAEAADVAVAVVVLLRRGAIPKTASGKIQRHACRRAVETGRWDVGGHAVRHRWDDAAGEEGPAAGGPARAGDAAGGGVGTSLGGEATDPPGVVELAGAVLGLPPGEVPQDAPLTRLGLDSLRAIELQGALDVHLGLRVPLPDLLTGITVSGIAALAPAARPDGPSGGDGPGDGEQAEPPDPDAGERPASDGQRALWLVQRWAPDSTAYQINRAARIRSPLDVAALERAFRNLVDRHPALRTRLPERDGQPVQSTFAWSGPVLSRFDVAGLDEPALRRRVQADADRPFDLARGPLFRAALYTRGPADHVLLLSLHHTITDFWSLSVMVDELLTGYADPAAPAGRRPGRSHPAENEPAGWRRYW